MIFEIVLIVAASLLIVVPQWIEGRSKLGHSRRLNQLRAGAPEQFFEERRSLETYPPKGRWTYRLLGAVVIIYAVASLALKP